MNFYFEKSNHTFIRYETIENIEIYNQFLNWLKGEFDLYLMEESDSLKVYFPNGLFSVTLFSDNEKDLFIEIKIKAKTLKTANQMVLRIETLYNHLNKVFYK
jgi:hypothetical protein